MVGSPDVRGRLGILKVHTKKTPMEEGVDLEVIAKGTPGFTGADLANLVNEAALNAARNNKKKLTLKDFEEAKDKVLMGPERRSLVISDKEKLMTAYHEAGHTIVGMNLPYTDPIHKVSIMPRGGALGVTQTLPNEDMLSLTNERAENFIAFLMGGRCAEEIVYGLMTSGASNDIERATGLARSMVTKWGMSPKMGPINYHKSSMSIYTGTGDTTDYSEKTAQEIDEEINRFVDKNYKQAIHILKTQRDALDRLAHALMVWETMDIKQVQDVCKGIDIGVPLKIEKKESSAKKESETKTGTEVTDEGLKPSLS
jgi:cell division protease FtsH